MYHRGTPEAYYTVLPSIIFMLEGPPSELASVHHYTPPPLYFLEGIYIYMYLLYVGIAVYFNLKDIRAIVVVCHNDPESSNHKSVLLRHIMASTATLQEREHQLAPHFSHVVGKSGEDEEKLMGEECWGERERERKRGSGGLRKTAWLKC